jgi:putative restriction endonuclease
MRYWWVNQNQTYRAELRGGFMWSPKESKGGVRNPFYDTMKDVSPGDVVFSYCDTRIKAIGVVTGHAQTGPKPDFGAAGANWSQEGWFVPVDYGVLNNQIRPKDHIAILRPFLPTKYSPLQPATGDGLQSVYLTEVPDSLGDALIALIGQAYFDTYADIVASPSAPDAEEFEGSDADRIIVGPTFREQIIRARRGQGVFRSNVLLREEYCRVTKVQDQRHLKASHIKPWRDATDAERLDGSNGLLLSPHIDHLFDSGYITFTSSQQLLIVPEVQDELLDKWSIDESVNVGEFSREQNAYLDYHRANVFKRHA